MENKNQPINQNQGSSNNASGSGTNPAISESEKEVKRREYLNKIITFKNDFIDKKVTYEQFEINRNNFYENGLGFFTFKELEKIEIEADKKREETNNDESDSEESENGYWEEASDQDQIKGEQAWQKQELERIKKDSLVIEAKREEQRKEQAKIEKKWEEQEQENQLLVNRERQLAKARKEKAVSVDNKEIIKAEISQELTAIKASFENIKISEANREEIKSKINKKANRAYLETKKLYWLPNSHFFNFKNTFQEECEQTVFKQVNKITTDLQKQRELAIAKTSSLIAARNQEVEQAQRAILQMADIIEKAKNDYSRLEKQSEEKITDLKNLSEEEISKLQLEIGRLNNQLKDYQKKKTNLEKMVKEEMDKASKAKPVIKPTLEGQASEITKLEKEIGTLKVAVKFFEDDRDHTKLELQHEKELRATSETNLKNQLERTTDRLNNIIADKNQEMEELKTTWQKHYNLEKEHKENAQKELKILLDKQVEESGEKIDLSAKNTDLKNKNERLKTEIRKLEETIKGLQPSYAYQLAEKFGIIKLKNTMVSIAVIIGVIATIYALSLVLKYIAKPAWLNLTEFFPKSKKRKVITVEAEEEAEENIFEVEAKPKLAPKKVKVLRSNTKVKPKSKTK